MLTRRCAKCILPHTFPGATFDANGVCDLCLFYTPPPPILGREALRQAILAGRGEQYDCVVPLSGGKDSTYVLYFAARELGLRPVAVNYDSGFQSEQAIRNMTKACEILGAPLMMHKVDFRKRRTIMRQVVRFAEISGVPCGVCTNCESNIRTIAVMAARKSGVRTILCGDSQGEHVGVPPFAGWRGMATGASHWKLVKLTIPLAKYGATAARERAVLGVPFKYAYTASQAPVPFPKDEVNVVHFFDFVNWEMIDKVGLLARELGWETGGERLDRFDCRLHPLDNFKWLKISGITKDGYVYCNWVRSGAITREKALEMEEKLVRTISQECAELVHDYGLSKRALGWLELCAKH